MKKKKSKQKKSPKKTKSKKKNIPKKYAPDRLTSKDKKKQIQALRRSRRAYKKGKYISRPKVKSYT